MLKYQIPGVFLLFCAFVLTLITSISLPYLPTLDIIRTYFGDRQVTIANEPSDQLRMGVWTYCHYILNGDRQCPNTGYAYSVLAFDVTTMRDISISSSWTRGLAVHPVTAIVTIVALVFSLVPRTFPILVACVLAFISVLLCFIAFLIDVALFAYAKNQFSGNAITGPGLWVNFAAMIVAGVASCSLFIGSRLKRAGDEHIGTASSSTEKRSFLARFRRNK